MSQRAPGPNGLPLIGALNVMLGDRLTKMMGLQKEYGDIVRLPFGGKDFHIVFHPDLVQQVLTKKAGSFYKGRTFGKARNFMGNGLATSEGDFWRSQRRLMNPFFTKAFLPKFNDTMIRTIQETLDGWHRARQQSVSLDAFPEFQTLAMNVVSRTLFGYHIPEEDNQAILDSVTYILRHVAARILNPFDFLEDLPLPSNYRYQKAVETLDAIVFKMIEAERSRSEPSGTLLSDLIHAKDPEGGRRMDEEQLRDELMTMFIGGIDTSGNTMAWTLYTLASHPEVYAKVKHLVQQELGDRKPTMQDFERLGYITQVINETLRLYPQNYAMSRDTLQDEELGGYSIKKDTTVFLGMYVVHRRADFWEEPEVFDPDRFAPDRLKSMHPFQFAPFGGGQRKCIGFNFAMIEMTLAFAMAMQQFEIQVPNAHEIVPEPKWSLMPKPGVRMMLDYPAMAAH